ncbi:coiled-coil domain-containing protein 96-like [Anthonomus grandis grandis]|uniref:coiled-coil domain-containing protein 96-like n=1 Tax=Anthonomus grandis grandis TaxID=2921223 RepID=UPI0021653DC4|nr:coiled-coil domain-containing protein 96-like [Anthonomus grandis grandis]
MAEVSAMRLTYIKLKQMVQEKLDGIALLDEIAPGFLLADYEQLKSLNRGYADKIEEKDEELTKQRAKCASTIQILAHLREKSSALETDLDDLEEELEVTEMTYADLRTKLNNAKQKKDAYRNRLNKLRDESGLLTQPTLLRDMEKGLSDLQTLTADLSAIMRDYKRRGKQIKVIRKKIETTQESRRLMGRSSSRFKRESTRVSCINDSDDDVTVKPQVYKGRPSLMMPLLESTVFDSLRSVKPKVTYDRRRYPVGIKHKRSEG